MILICYDGSADAKAAVENAGMLLRGQPAIVLTVWEPFSELLARSPSFGAAPTAVEADEVDEQSRASAQLQSEEGAALARRAGLEATPRTAAQTRATALAILEQAEEVRASAIVIGSRGLTGLKSILLGSVSHAVIQRADRTVIVVPSPRVAEARERERQGGE